MRARTREVRAAHNGKARSRQLRHGVLRIRRLGNTRYRQHEIGVETDDRPVIAFGGSLFVLDAQTQADRELRSDAPSVLTEITGVQIERGRTVEKAHRGEGWQAE